jgi:hypothetical protein
MEEGLVTHCMWCGQAFPEPINPKNHEFARAHIPEIASLDDWVDALERDDPNVETTIIAEQLAIDLVIGIIYIWVHETCRDACMAAMGCWFRLLKDHNVMPVRRDTWQYLVTLKETHRPGDAYEL